MQAEPTTTDSGLTYICNFVRSTLNTQKSSYRWQFTRCLHKKPRAVSLRTVDNARRSLCQIRTVYLIRSVLETDDDIYGYILWRQKQRPHSPMKLQRTILI